MCKRVPNPHCLPVTCYRHVHVNPCPAKPVPAACSPVSRRLSVRPCLPLPAPCPQPHAPASPAQLQACPAVAQKCSICPSHIVMPIVRQWEETTLSVSFSPDSCCAASTVCLLLFCPSLFLFNGTSPGRQAHGDRQSFFLPFSQPVSWSECPSIVFRRERDRKEEKAGREGEGKGRQKRLN